MNSRVRDCPAVQDGGRRKIHIKKNKNCTNTYAYKYTLRKNTLLFNIPFFKKLEIKRYSFARNHYLPPFVMSLRKIFLGLSAINAVTFGTSMLRPEAGFDVSLNSIAPIEIAAQKFFNSQTGEQFFLKGVAYQPTKITESWNSEIVSTETKYVDPLAEESVCMRDIPYFQKLGVNTLRVYAIDPNKNHDVCMQALAEAGIYVLLDLSEPDISIERNNPEWNIQLWSRYIAVVDAMQKYPNILGFFAGNEVTSDETNTEASPFVKAAIRDVKNYINTKGYRKIPVGYSSNDDAATRDSLAQYFACDGELSADFYGINMYEWCGYSSYGTSGYKERTKEFSNYPIPVFFSEFGCNAIRPRPFTEVGALFGPKMSKVWSGGLAYMYFEEENGYGLVKINDNGAVTELDDFQFLQKEFNSATPQGIEKDEYLKDANYKLSSESLKCPVAAAADIIWEASTNIPPSPSPEKCHCLEEILPCLVISFEENWDYQQYFDYACSQVDCSDIVSDGKAGIYGEFSDCLPEQKLALQISKMYHTKGHPTGRCPMNGKNVFFNSKSMSATDAVCSKVAERVLSLQNPESKKLGKSRTTITPKSENADAPKTLLHANSGPTSRKKNLGYTLITLSVIFAATFF